MVVRLRRDDSGRRYVISPRRKSDDGRLDDKVPINSTKVKQTGDVKNGKSDDRVQESELPVNSGGIPQNVRNVWQSGGSVMTNATQTAQSGVSLPNRPESDFIEDEASEVEETWDEDGDEEEGDTEVTDDRIVVRGKDRSTLEVEARMVGYVDEVKRLKDMKIPRLPKFVLEAKKKGGQVLRLEAVIDYVETPDGKTIYFIRNKREVIDKLYEFRANRHISKALINDALDAWLTKIEPASLIKWVDALEVVKGMPEWDEINRDPVGFFLRRANTVVGNEKVKIATLLAVVSSQLVRLEEGIYRIHLILTGRSGAGKSSTIRSVTRLFYEYGEVDDWIVWRVTRFTQRALGYVQVDNFDGHVVFIEQLDNVEGIEYMREAMSEGKITTVVTTKDPETGEMKAVQRTIEGQPSFIATDVTSKVDRQILNRSFQLYLPQTDDQALRKVLEQIVFRRPPKDDDIERTKLVTYVWLKTRPKDPVVTEEVGKELIDVLTTVTTKDNIKRATEIARNLVRAVASMFGHDKVEASDLEFALKYFKKDVLLTTLELSERDLEVLKWFRDHGYVWSDEKPSEVPTGEVAVSFGMSTNEMKVLLDKLYDRGLLAKKYDGKRFLWSLSDYGLRVLDVLEEKLADGAVVELRDEKGEVVGLAEGSFRPDDDSRGNRQDAVRGPDGRGVSGDQGKAQGLTDEEIAVLKKAWESHGRVHESSLSDREKETARRLAEADLLWYYNGWFQITKDGLDALEGRQGGRSVLEAYDYLKRRGPTLVAEFADKFGADVLEALKRKDLVTFNVVGNEEYVYAK